MKCRIELSQEHYNSVRKILNTYLPPNAKVWVFGSRATGKTHQGSDLDLAIDLGYALPSELETDLRFAFEDSDLPWTVDLVDMQRIGGIFRENVERDRVELARQGFNSPSSLSQQNKS